MKKTCLLIFLLTFTGIFAQGPFAPQYFNNVCDANNDGFASFAMLEIEGEIVGNSQNYQASSHLTLFDAENNLNPIENGFVNTSNPQTVYARYYNIITNDFEVFPYILTIIPTPIATPLTLTACANDGLIFAAFNLDEAAQMVWDQNQSNATIETISFYDTQFGAEYGYNTLPNLFQSNATQQTIYYRVTNVQTNCYSFSTLNLISESCANPNCLGVTNIEVSNITETSASLSWTESGDATAWEISISAVGLNIIDYEATSNPFTIIDLPCNTNITCYVRSVCDSNEFSSWNSFDFNTSDCLPIGPITTLYGCLDNGISCIDLTQNTALALENLNAADYAVSYHTSYSGAFYDTDLVLDPSNYCITSLNNTAHIRVEEIANPANYIAVSFGVSAQFANFETATSIAALSACDDDANDEVVFDLTEAESNMNNATNVSYFINEYDAGFGVNAFPNPSAYTVDIAPYSSFIYAKATYDDATCGIIYKINLKAYALCDNAYICSEANSLCSTLNQPFLNTFQGIVAETGNNYGCLGLNINPTWFYLPVSADGDLQFTIEQSTDINFSTADLDVNFICYGPYTTPTEACGQTSLTSIVDCSNSPAATEIVDIPNAQAGEYYLIMVINYSSQPGYLKITQEVGENQGGLDCAGLNLNAFLDTNGNGTQENDEIDFPLGTFTFQKNEDGNNINVTSPNGEYNIYDDDESNSYDVSFSVLAEYASNYNVIPSSYENVSVVIGGGLQTYNFPITPSENYMDVAAYIVPILQPRPGFFYKNKVVYTNLGNQTIANGTVTFTKDANVVIVNISQTGAVPNTNGFTYEFTNLMPFEERTIFVTMQVPPIPTVELGQLLTNTVSILPITGDAIPSNNYNAITQTIIGSYDPNDKMESRGSEILHSSFTSEDYLFYTIRFENTGTASAINVRIEDLLDAKLDENSIRMIDASHDYILERNDNALTWYFDNIQLPHTAADPILSNGFVYFKIKPKPGYEVGDIISNTAEIYFDFNPAIITNTFNSEFVVILNVATFDASNVLVYPNPASNQVTVSLSKTSELLSKISVVDVLGKHVLHLNHIDGISKIIDVNNLTKGVYFIEIETQNQLIIKQKLIINN